jgi:hypothetical protein
MGRVGRHFEVLTERRHVLSKQRLVGQGMYPAPCEVSVGMARLM